MTEKIVSLILGAGRAMRLAPTPDEPSHIHVVRPSRVRQGTVAEGGAHRVLRLGHSADERPAAPARRARAA